MDWYTPLKQVEANKIKLRQKNRVARQGEALKSRQNPPRRRKLYRSIGFVGIAVDEDDATAIWEL